MIQELEKKKQDSTCIAQTKLSVM